MGEPDEGRVLCKLSVHCPRLSVSVEGANGMEWNIIRPGGWKTPCQLSVKPMKS